MKAADIAESAMLAAIKRDIAEGNGFDARTWSLAEREGWPVKVATAKLRKMQQRGLVDGCPCGCRGGWTIEEAAAS
ncbi:hypothetical protein LCGC14_0789940 [marine sediment metagenome]|uniref:Uncharacterized protein n=1 Tax=marine sediment metagenome TaxID=412755 RepID=A0A0F9PX78_9ZZZZ